MVSGFRVSWFQGLHDQLVILEFRFKEKTNRVNHETMKPRNL